MMMIGNPQRLFKSSHRQKQFAHDACPWCRHIRCADCAPDRFPALADGCCCCGSPAIARRLDGGHADDAGRVGRSARGPP